MSCRCCWIVLVLLVGSRSLAQEGKIDLPPNQLKAIEQGIPKEAPAKPARARKVLIYTRLQTHLDPTKFAAKSIELLGQRTGAFEVTHSADPAVFDPRNLAQFDAVVMNNTHEARPMLPADWKKLTPEQIKPLAPQEEACKKSLLDFVESGKGLVGIHAANAGVRWPEYEQMIGGTYSGHFGGAVTIKAEDPAHPLCAMFPAGRTITLNDEIYAFKTPYAREHVRVLLSLDMTQTKDPGTRKDGDYPISWIRKHGKGRVFYCSVPAHSIASYQNPLLMQHVLAGIQFALGDLEAPAEPVKK